MNVSLSLARHTKAEALMCGKNVEDSSCLSNSDKRMPSVVAISSIGTGVIAATVNYCMTINSITRPTKTGVIAAAVHCPTTINSITRPTKTGVIAATVHCRMTINTITRPIKTGVIAATVHCRTRITASPDPPKPA